MPRVRHLPWPEQAVCEPVSGRPRGSGFLSAETHQESRPVQEAKGKRAARKGTKPKSTSEVTNPKRTSKDTKPKSAPERRKPKRAKGKTDQPLEPAPALEPSAVPNPEQPATSQPRPRSRSWLRGAGARLDRSHGSRRRR